MNGHWVLGDPVPSPAYKPKETLASVRLSASFVAQHKADAERLIRSVFQEPVIKPACENE
jgi:hypothetical protein